MADCIREGQAALDLGFIARHEHTPTADAAYCEILMSFVKIDSVCL